MTMTSVILQDGTLTFINFCLKTSTFSLWTFQCSPRPLMMISILRVNYLKSLTRKIKTVTGTENKIKTSIAHIFEFCCYALLLLGINLLDDFWSTVTKQHFRPPIEIPKLAVIGVVWWKRYSEFRVLFLQKTLGTVVTVGESCFTNPCFIAGKGGILKCLK